MKRDTIKMTCKNLKPFFHANGEVFDTRGKRYPAVDIQKWANNLSNSSDALVKRFVRDLQIHFEGFDGIVSHIDRGDNELPPQQHVVWTAQQIDRIRNYEQIKKV